MRKHSGDMFPHTITVYNVVPEPAPVGERPKFTNYMTVLRGVFVDERKGMNVRESGLISADAVNINIPADVDARDAVTGEPKRYIGPHEWSQLVRAGEDISGVWTMTLDGEGDGDTFVIRGEVVEPILSLEWITEIHDGVYNITKVDDKRYGGLPHWEVGGE